MIYYFSGTGNSAYVARRLAKATGQGLRDASVWLRGEGNAPTAGLSADEPLVFVAPTYAWRLPKVLDAWVRSVEWGAGREAYFVLTCGSEAGDAARHNHQLCRAAKLAYRGTGVVVMPENYIAMFRAPGEQEAREIVRRAEPVIDELTGRIMRGDDIVDAHPGLLDRVKSGPVNAAFYALQIKLRRPHVAGACTGCEACVRSCPPGNVELQVGRPVWGAACTQCMACVSACPA